MKSVRETANTISYRLRVGALANAKLRGRVFGATYDAIFEDWRRRNPCRWYPNTQRTQLFQHVFDTQNLGRAITYLEFGVNQGDSMRWWVERNHDADTRFIGFDTFTGLPEDWVPGYTKGTFDRAGVVPDLGDSRCRFLAGLFQDTLTGFLREYPPDGPLVVHMDADLYSATLYVLVHLAPHLKRGDVLLFDQFGFPTHEFRAFLDATAAYPMRCTALARTGPHYRVAFRVE